MNFTFAVISWVLKSQLTTVKRWAACSTSPMVRGRRPLLTVEQEKDIVEAVLDAARNHKAMTPSAVREMPVVGAISGDISDMCWFTGFSGAFLAGPRSS